MADEDEENTTFMDEGDFNDDDDDQSDIVSQTGTQGEDEDTDTDTETDTELELGIDTEDDIVDDLKTSDLKVYQEILNKQVFRTHAILTKYEKPRLIGTRAEQIARGAPTFVEIGDSKSPIEIAEREFQEGKLPFKLNRRLPGKGPGSFLTERRLLKDLVNIH